MNKEKLKELAIECGVVGLSIDDIHNINQLEAFANRIMQECGKDEPVAYAQDCLIDIFLTGSKVAVITRDKSNDEDNNHYTLPLYIHPKNDDCELLQAKIDELMLEYCPDEMTKEQLENYGNNQITAGEPGKHTA